jgi:hypothetical protein
MAIMFFQEFLNERTGCGTSKEEFDYVMATYPDEVDDAWKEYTQYIKDNPKEVMRVWGKYTDFLEFNKYITKNETKIIKQR